MKTERRHELQHNALADALGNVVEGVKPYQQIVLGCILAVVVVIGVGRYLSIRSQADDVSSWNSYLRASAADNLDDLSDVVERHAGTSAALWSSLYIGDRRLERGLEQLFVNKLDAKDELKKAEEAYLAVQSRARDPLLLQRAALGLGRVYESNVELDKARAQYQQLKDKWPKSVYAGAAQKRLDDLAEKSTKEFYDWFAMHEPRSRTPEGPGTPGMRPPFSLDGLDSQSAPDLGPGTKFRLDDSSDDKPVTTTEPKTEAKSDTEAPEKATSDEGDKPAASEPPPVKPTDGASP